MSKVENKQYSRQFEVKRNYFDKEGIAREQHIFTTDSFREAVEIASKSLVTGMNGEFTQLLVYEADGETLVARFHEIDIVNLYKIKRYLF